MNAHPSLAAVLDQHSERGEGCCYHCCDDEVCGVGAFSIAEHQARKWREARTITDADALDSLPVGSIIRDAEGNALQCDKRPGAWFYPCERYQFDGDGIPLPVLVLWHPDWSDQ